MKECFKCREVKPLSEFYKHKMMADGHLGKCKDCARADVSANRAANLDYYREYDRDRGSRQTAEDVRRYRAANRIKHAAHVIVRQAITRKLLKRPLACEKCGERCRAHAHHDDYAQPLTVRWLCAACHQAWHKENGEGKT